LEILRAAPPPGVEERDTPLIFLHGAFAGAWCWAENFLPFFAARGYRVLAPSLRGHGGSGGRADLHRHGIRDYIADIEHVLNDLDDPPVVVGHSMGGFLGMLLAEKRDLAALALVASVPPTGLMGPSSSLAMWNPLLMFEIGMVQSGRPRMMSESGLRQALFSDTMPRAQAAKLLPMMGPESHKAVTELHGLIHAQPERIRDRMPVAVLGAEQDRLIPAPYVRATARAFRTEATVLSGLGHGLMLDHAWETAALHLAQWLDAHDI
jgi:pimeloyl-ACP methyl ester carboxylesterase